MGTSGPSKEEIREKERIKQIGLYKIERYYSAYLSIKNILKEIYEHKDKDISSKKLYLIVKKSIGRYIDILTKYKVFDNLKKEKEKESEKTEKEKELEKELKKNLETEFEKYDSSTDIAEIYSNYKDCKDKINNDHDNKFVIVDEEFIKQFRIGDSKYKDVKIKEIVEDSENKTISLKITFPIPKKVIKAQEIKGNNGIFKFIENEDNESNDESSESMKDIIGEEDDIDTFKGKKFESLIKSITYCLITIRKFKLAFLTNGDALNKDTKISKILFDIIGQSNNKEDINFSELIEYIELTKLNEIKNVLEFILNRIAYEKIINIDEFFYLQELLINKCQKCGDVISCNSYVNKFIEFSMDNFLSNNQLDIYNCFDSLTVENIVTIKCSKCDNLINSSFVRIEIINDILPIILNRGKNVENKINFKLDYKINISKYFQNSEQKNEFELISFSSFYSDKNIYKSFYKNNDDDKWYCFNGKNVSISNDENDGIPVLLFYKKVSN